MTRRRVNPNRFARGFTLLEAILALGILAAATIVSLGVRMDLLRSSSNLRAAQREDRDHEALFEMLVSGMLDAPTTTKDGRIEWTGEFLGTPYRITRKAEWVDNPMVGVVKYEVAPRVAVFRYTIEHDGRESTEIWHE